MKKKIILLVLSASTMVFAQSYRLSRSGFTVAGGRQSSSQHVAASQMGVSAFSNMYSDSYSMGTVTEVAVPAAQMPKRFALLQNYPNPFNLGTTVTWQLPRPAKVRVAVYSLLGECVAVLFQGLQPAGEYRFHYAGIDQNGRLLASGVYFVRMEADAFQQVVKMAVIK